MKIYKKYKMHLWNTKKYIFIVSFATQIVFYYGPVLAWPHLMWRLRT